MELNVGPGTERASARMSALSQLTEFRVAPAPAEARVSSSHLVVRVLVLCLLFSAGAVYEAIKVSSVNASDVWVHLSTGLWILQNHSIPRTGLFSQYPNLTWSDSTWGFDLLLGGGYRLLGLQAVPIALVVMKLALAIVTFHLARTSRVSFWNSVLLSAVAQCLIPLHPAPYACSVVFFAVELRLLLQSRETGSAKNLFWLPLLFVFWANLHLQFVAGLVLLVFFAVAVTLEHGYRSFPKNLLSDRILPLDLKQVGIAGCLSFLAAFATPYPLRLLPAAFKVLYSPMGFEHFSEMSSMTFRTPRDYLLMLLVMLAFLAMGRRRSLELFELMTLIAGTLLAFRVDRDGWLAVLPAISVLARGFSRGRGEDESWQPERVIPSPVWPLAASVFILGISALALLPSSASLMRRISTNFPVKASDYIRENHLAQPMFNEYSWGSFLTWYLPEYPVVVDSRLELYGNDNVARYFDIVGGKELLESDPIVARAGTLLLEKESAMAKALTNLPALSAQYRLVYSDDIASVFVPQNKKLP